MQGLSGQCQMVLPIPASTEPDISLGAAITSNHFPSNGSSQTVVYHIAEVGGNLSVGDTLRLAKVHGFSFALNVADFSVLVGGSLYFLDNYRWKAISTDPTYFYLILKGPNNAIGSILPNQQLHVSLVITRNTDDVSSFALVARLRRANGELNLTNNHHSLALFAE